MTTFPNSLHSPILNETNLFFYGKIRNFTFNPRPRGKKITLDRQLNFHDKNFPCSKKKEKKKKIQQNIFSYKPEFHSLPNLSFKSESPFNLVIEPMNSVPMSVIVFWHDSYLTILKKSDKPSKAMSCHVYISINRQRCTYSNFYLLWFVDDAIMAKMVINAPNKHNPLLVVFPALFPLVRIGLS